MYKKSILLIVALGLFAGSAVHAANIIWVGETDDQNADGIVDDSRWPVWLGEQGYSVDSQPNNWLVMDAAKVDVLNQADLVIISRNTDSGDYINGNEATLWNSVTAPMILLSPYLSRANRWRWVNSDGLTNLTQAPAWEAVVPAHVIFSGVELNANQVTAIDGSVSSLGTYHMSAAVDVGNGTLLARVAGAGDKAIVEWAPGVEFFAGGPMVAARRLLFCAGTTESGTSFPQGAFNLTPAGQKLLLNAIRYMLGDTQKGLAVAPWPQDEATGVSSDSVLSWTAGEYAAKHDVYLGTSFNDVSNASSAEPLGVLVNVGQDANTYDPAGALAFGQTYYWRIDEVNAAPDFVVIKGDVWSFTVEPFAYPIQGVTATTNALVGEGAGIEVTINGSGLNNLGQHTTGKADMWLGAPGDGPVWLQYDFDRLYKLHQLLVWNYNIDFASVLGFGVKGVTVEYSADGVEWTTLGDVEFAQAPGSSTYTANTTIDLQGVAARSVRLTVNSTWGGKMDQFGLSEVRFLYVPVCAAEPQPANEATGVAVESILSWRAGREAVSHDVYLGTDPEALAVAGTTQTTSYSPGPLDLGTTYYWKVNEVDPVSVWEGDVWSFSTSPYLVVDDFENYTNDSPNRVFQTWIDGAGFSPDQFFPNGNPGNGSGSYAGYDPALGNIMETAIIHGGRQSLPIEYNGPSEVIRAFAPAQDWTQHGIKSLSLWFCGAVGNTGQLYVKINNTKVIYGGDAVDIKRPVWQVWNIDLSAVGGVNKVTSLTIGIEGAGASGLVFMDDIRLYKSAPQAAGEVVWLEAESAKTIPIYWDLLSDRTDASNGKYVAVKAGNNSMEAPPVTDGTLSYTFTVKGGVYTLHARTIVPTADDNSLWLRIQGATTQTTNHVSGWVWWYDIAEGSNWHWDTVRSNNDGGRTVQFTLPAGTYTLEVAYREDGLLVDAFIITDKLD